MEPRIEDQLAELQQIRARFGCTFEQLGQQYEANAADLKADEAKARASGKKYRGWTAEQYAEKHALYTMRAKGCALLALA